MEYNLKNTEHFTLQRDSSFLLNVDELTDITTDLLTNITYAELKALRDTSALQPGMQYRITDYQCTTTQADTSSAGNQFDIIVTADSRTVLNENARAIQHTDSSADYFAKCDLNAWELKYTLDNDSSTFAWADTSNGKGIIYYMKDEWNNECPYDFKNIMFRRWEITSCPKCPSLVVNNDEREYNPYCFYYGAKWDGDTAIQSSDASYGNANRYFYTFALKDLTNEDWFDYTVVANLGLKNFEETKMTCHDNHIGNFTDEYSSGNKMLNNIVFFNVYTDLSDTSYADDYSYCFSNTFGNDCYSNTFGNRCYSNTFGNSCYTNTFGNRCYSNTFRNGCQYNTFGSDCYSNMIRSDYYSNIFGNGCQYSTFGNGCRYNTFGDDYQNNIFGNSCYTNTFGNGCFSNTFGDSCNFNTLGDGCQSNTFGNDCRYNTFGDFCYYNTFGNGCINIKFGNSSSAKSYYQYIIVENGNYKIYLDTIQTTSYSNKIQNIKIVQGVNNTNTWKTISHNTVNDTFQTVYQPTNSQTISV